MMLTHVDELSGLLHALERCFYDSLRTSDECHDCTVCGFARIDIQDLYPT